MKLKDRILAAAAYIFGIPALYIILTENRHRPFLGYHGTQALKLWLIYLGSFFALRLIINLIWLNYYVPALAILENMVAAAMAGYALYCGYRSLAGQKFTLFH